MLALHLPDRLCEIDLHVTSSMLASIVQVTQKPCQALKSIRITLTGPPILLHNAFLGGSAPHLREIKLDGIAFPFPSIRQVLLSTNNLVELHLGHIPNDAYFSPNDLATGLFASVQLERLTVDFHSPASSPPSIMTGRLSQRTTLPSLIFFDFHGASGYLEEFVAQIELPALCRIAIRFFNDIFFEIPQFYKFILRLNALRTPTRVIIKHNVDSVGVIFEEGQPLSENCFLGISCRQLDWQLSFVTEILSQLFPLLSSVQSLDIQSGDELPTGEEDVDSTQWLELLRPFTHVTQAYVWEKLVSGIVQALAAEDMTTEILPELTLLHLSGYRSSPQVAKVATQFVDTRRLSGRTISLISGDEVRYCSSYHIIMLIGGGGNNKNRSRRKHGGGGRRQGSGRSRRRRGRRRRRRARRRRRHGRCRCRCSKRMRGGGRSGRGSGSSCSSSSRCRDGSSSYNNDKNNSHGLNKHRNHPSTRPNNLRWHSFPSTPQPMSGTRSVRELLSKASRRPSPDIPPIH